MQLTLMNHDYKIAKILVRSEVLNSKKNIEPPFIDKLEVYDVSRLPFAVKYASEASQIKELENWMLHRIIPPHRDGGDYMCDIMNCNFFEASLRAHGASLTDGYWFKNEVEDNLKWKDVNFYDRRFSYDMGNVDLQDHKDPLSYVRQPNFFDTPDATTNGQMKKAWRRRDGKIILLKQGLSPDFEQPFNEKTASDLLARICNVPYVSYSLVNVNGHICSVCQNFITDGIEFVPASDIYHTDIKPIYISLNEYMEERCKFFKIPNYKDFFDNMHLIDFIIANSDRHLGNYGFLYDINKLQFIGPAPIFDNGTSLWSNVSIIPDEISEEKVKEFAKTVQLHHPANFDISRIQNIKAIIENAYTGAYISPERIAQIVNFAEQRVQIAERGIEQQTKYKQKILDHKHTSHSHAHAHDLEY